MILAWLIYMLGVSYEVFLPVALVVMYIVLLVWLVVLLGLAINPLRAAARQARIRQAATAHLPIDGQGHIAADVSCAHCAYNLRGLDPRTACPECNTPCDTSIGLHLANQAAPLWPKDVAAGMTLVAVALAADVVMTLAGVALDLLLHLLLPSLSQWQAWWYGLRSGIWWAIAAVLLAGVWQATPPPAPGEPGGPGELPRKTARIAFGLCFFLTGTFSLGGSVLVWLVVSRIVQPIVVVLAYASVLLHVRHLALRVQDARLAGWARRASRIVLVAGVPLVGIGVFWSFYIWARQQGQPPTPWSLQLVYVLTRYADLVLSILIAGMTAAVAAACVRRFRRMAGGAP